MEAGSQKVFFIGQVSMGTHTLSGTLEIAYYSRDETTYKMSFPGIAWRVLKVCTRVIEYWVCGVQAVYE